MSNDPRRLDSRLVPLARGETRAFITVKDEEVRLPFMLDYHRRLGVDRFFINDNRSVDGSRDYALAQPDCHVFASDGSFRAANQGIDWLNALVEKHGDGHWCLFLDADECFAYPYCEQVKLHDFCAFLEQTGAEGVFGFLLDMYGQMPVRDALYEPGTPFLQSCPYFDRDYQLRPATWRPGGRPFPGRELIGGPRLRLFYPHLAQAPASRWAAAKMGRAIRNSSIGRRAGLQKTDFGTVPPLLNKVPLIKGGGGRRWASNHASVPLRLSNVSSVSLHFKYFSDFHNRAIASHREYWDGNREYQQYSRLLAMQPDVSFFYSNSELYRDTEQLVELGLLRIDPLYSHFLERYGVSVEKPRFPGPHAGTHAVEQHIWP